MRVITALALFLCLPVSCLAGEWFTTDQTGTDAFRHEKWGEALAAFEAAWPLARTPTEQAITANNRGAALNALTRYEESLSWFEKSLALWKMQPGHAKESVETAVGLADVARALGRFGLAEQALRSLLPGTSTANLPNEMRAGLLNSLGDMLREQARTTEARAVFESAQALEGLSATRQIEICLGLADIERGAGNSAAAIRQAERAIQLARENRPAAAKKPGGVAESAGTESAATQDEALGLRILGLTWYESHDFTRAEPLLRRSLAIFRQQPTAQPRQVAASLTCLAHLYRAQGKYSLAEESWLLAYQLQRQVSGDRHPQTAAIMEGLASLYTHQKRYAEAADLASRAWVVMSETFGSDSIPAAGALVTIAVVEQGQKRLDAAASSYARALDIFRARGGLADRNIASVMDRYATVLAALHRQDEAKHLREEIKAFSFSGAYK
jgi:tetratricopeptide (TPR) repeat protein